MAGISWQKVKMNDSAPTFFDNKNRHTGLSMAVVGVARLLLLALLSGGCRVR